MNRWWCQVEFLVTTAVMCQEKSPFTHDGKLSATNILQQDLLSL